MCWLNSMHPGVGIARDFLLYVSQLFTFKVYESLAAAYKNKKDVVIVNLDADNYKDLGEKFVTFINEKCGTSRYAKGQLTSTDGLIAELDSLVKEFVTAGSDEKKALYAKIEEEVGKVTSSTSRYGKIYVKDAKSSLTKGCDYAKNEIQRLERILSKSISPTKADEFTLKKNILSAFA
ncbi:unnamed protein product [Lactuca virosa]|uniref:protein disulfide-isomerase n=1 Tax=Lactuca virosa TaxID=75947 RepID=A0AAU9LL13_9ASTR|nr:unnamed protein product [Lactuca virosa]